jgi:hypothetical protein
MAKQQLNALCWQTNQKNEYNINNQTVPLATRKTAAKTYIDTLKKYKVRIAKPSSRGVITESSANALYSRDFLRPQFARKLLTYEEYFGSEPPLAPSKDVQTNATLLNSL